MPPKTVVFACVHNAGRSQIAAAFFSSLADPSRARAVSAGTEPAGSVHAVVVDAMRDVGIDLSGASPRLLARELVSGAHLLVTMGCGENCPAVPGLSMEDWDFEDPKGQPIEKVRAIRDEIRARVADLVARLGCEKACPGSETSGRGRSSG